MDWKQLLVSITGSVDQEVRVRNEYLAAENRILSLAGCSWRPTAQPPEW